MITRERPLGTRGLVAAALSTLLLIAGFVGVAPAASAVPTGAPSNVSASVVDATTVAVSFDAPAYDGGWPITGYTVTSSPGGLTGSAAWWEPQLITVSGLTTDASYTFTVTATNQDGVSSASAASNAVTPSAPSVPTTVPGAPSNLTATGGTGTIDLAWSAPAADGGSAITGYRIDVSATDASSGFTTLFDASPADRSYSNAGLADSATRWYRVFALNAEGDSATYAEATATTDAAPGSNTVPGAPASASAVGGVSQATFTWTPPVDDGGLPLTYTVLLSFTSSASGFDYERSGLTDLSYTETELADGEQMWFRVYAVNSLGRSVGYAEATATAVTPTEVTYAIGCDAGQTVSYTLDPGERLVLNMAPACHGIRKLAAGDSWHAQAFDTTLGGYLLDLNNQLGLSTMSDLTPFRYTAVADGYGYAMSDQFFLTPDADSASVNRTTVRIAITGTPRPPSPTPTNDDIENAVILPVGSVTASGDSTGATLQQGEYNGTGDIGTHTVWFTWTAPESSAGTATIDTCGSGFDTTLAVFAAGTFATPLAENDDACAHQSSVTFPVTPGASYSIQVNGYSLGDFGAFVLNYSVAGGTATPVGPTPGGGGSSSPAAESGSGSSEPSVAKPVKVPAVPTVVPQTATAMIGQTARITAPSSRRFAVGTDVVLAKKAVKTSAGVTVRWSRSMASKGTCSVSTVRGRAVATMLKPGRCTVIGRAAAPSAAYLPYQVLRTYRVR